MTSYKGSPLMYLALQVLWLTDFKTQTQFPFLPHLALALLWFWLLRQHGCDIRWNTIDKKKDINKCTASKTTTNCSNFSFYASMSSVVSVGSCGKSLDLKLIEQLSKGELDNSSYGSTQPAARNSPQIKVP